MCHHSQSSLLLDTMACLLIFVIFSTSTKSAILVPIDSPPFYIDNNFDCVASSNAPFFRLMSCSLNTNRSIIVTIITNKIVIPVLVSSIIFKLLAGHSKNKTFLFCCNYFILEGHSFFAYCQRRHYGIVERSICLVNSDSIFSDCKPFEIGMSLVEIL